MAKVTLNIDSASQWVSKMVRLFFADEYVRHEVGTQSTKNLPQLQKALQAVKNVLPDLETRVIEFLAEWTVALLMPSMSWKLGHPTWPSCSLRTIGSVSCTLASK